MATVVTEDRRQLEATEQASMIVSGIQNRGDHNLVALIEGGKGTFARQVGAIDRTKVAVEVGRGIERLAQGVVRQHGEVRAETLFHFQDRAFI